jgi:hypothetical protein
MDPRMNMQNWKIAVSHEFKRLNEYRGLCGDLAREMQIIDGATGF